MIGASLCSGYPQRRLHKDLLSAQVLVQCCDAPYQALRGANRVNHLAPPEQRMQRCNIASSTRCWTAAMHVVRGSAKP